MHRPTSRQRPPADPPQEPPRTPSRLNPLRWVSGYAHWLHTMWPAGETEKLPISDDYGQTNVPGLYLIGDLRGVPLLKLGINAGVDVVRKIAPELRTADNEKDVLDIAIIGGGAAGFAAGKEAEKLGLRYCVFEASEPFSTVVNFPKGKYIYTYPTETPVEGDIAFHEKSQFKEGLLEDLREQTVDQGVRWMKAHVSHVKRRRDGFEVVLSEETRDSGNPAATTPDSVIKARRVIVAIGRSGNYRRLDVPGEGLDKVYNRLHDPADFCSQNVLVIGGGDSAIETAVALEECGANVTLSYRGGEFTRPKPENLKRLYRVVNHPEDTPAHLHEEMESSDFHQSPAAGDYAGVDHARTARLEREGRPGIALRLGSTVRAIRENEVEIQLADGRTETIPNDSVFPMLGREAPLEFFRKSRVKIRNEHDWFWWTSLIGFLIFCFWLYHWKSGFPFFGINGLALPAWLNFDPAQVWSSLGRAVTSAQTPKWLDLGSIWNEVTGWFQTTASSPESLLHTLKQSASGRSFYYTLTYSLLVVGFGITRIRRKKTPYIFWQTLTLMTIQVLPLFILPEIILPWMQMNGWFDAGALAWIANELFPKVDYWPGREFWRAYGLILAWPLFVYNWFTADPLWGWIILGFIQTFVIIPAMVYTWGKGAYCGWICSCGALAETMGDQHRIKMPHGVFWNRFNMLGQVFLLAAVVLMGLRILGWMGWAWAAALFDWGFSEIGPLSYGWFVDILWAGILGVGLYFWFSGRVWCRFACPLAALMHIYHRFGRFAIIPDKKKCISCNVCTSVCHQGIDIMSFANKGLPMKDPQCVRCSACLYSCPTGVLQFGRVDGDGNTTSLDPAWLAASPVIMRESKPVPLHVNGRKV